MQKSDRTRLIPVNIAFSGPLPSTLLSIVLVLLPASYHELWPAQLEKTVHPWVRVQIWKCRVRIYEAIKIDLFDKRLHCTHKNNNVVAPARPSDYDEPVDSTPAQTRPRSGSGRSTARGERHGRWWWWWWLAQKTRQQTGRVIS